MKKTPVMLLKTIGANRGGVTKATIKRANLYAENYSNVIILTTNFQINHKSIINELYKTKELSKEVKVYNFFEYYRMQTKNLKAKNKDAHKIEEKGFNVIKMSETDGYTYRYYEDGFYKKSKKYDENKNLQIIDYREHGFLRNRREEYDLTGKLVRIRHVDPRNNKYILDQYYGLNNKCILTVHLNSTTGNEGNVIHFNNVNKFYKSMMIMQREWVYSILSRYKDVVLMGEQRYHDFILFDKKRSFKTVFVVHANHLLSPYSDVDKPSPAYKKLLKSENVSDKIVVLTEEQKEDMKLIESEKNKVTVIPHAWNKNEDFKEEVERELEKVVMIARYVKDKRVNHAIKSFIDVIKVLPNAKLEIFGMGPLEKDLQKLIVKEKLEKNVLLKGYTNNPHKEYLSATCTLITSHREAFGMVITESLAAGAPVIAYDFKYGPQDIILNNENGIIVENGNIEELSQAIIKILSTPELQNNLSEKAFEIKQTFSEKKYNERWLSLIEEI